MAKRKGPLTPEEFVRKHPIKDAKVKVKTPLARFTAPYTASGRLSFDDLGEHLAQNVGEIKVGTDKVSVGEGKLERVGKWDFDTAGEYCKAFAAHAENGGNDADDANDADVGAGAASGQ